MREILFRGKIGNGTWVEGSLVISSHEDAGVIQKSYKIEDITYGTFPNDYILGFSKLVIPETFGQFTGILDTNDNKIFENDIISFDIISKYNLFIVVFNNGSWKAKQLISQISYIDQEYCNWEKHATVVGNTYDNPELLKLMDKEELKEFK